MEPIYTPKNTIAAYQLNWALTIFWKESTIEASKWLNYLKESCEIDDIVLSRLKSMIENASDKKGFMLSQIAILADHIHFSLGCSLEYSPEDIVLSFMNNCAYICGMKAVFKYSYYVGTFGEYDLGVFSRQTREPPR